MAERYDVDPYINMMREERDRSEDVFAPQTQEYLKKLRGRARDISQEKTPIWPWALLALGAWKLMDR